MLWPIITIITVVAVVAVVADFDKDKVADFGKDMANATAPNK